MLYIVGFCNFSIFGFLFGFCEYVEGVGILFLLFYCLNVIYRVFVFL